MFVDRPCNKCLFLIGLMRSPSQLGDTSRLLRCCCCCCFCEKEPLLLPLLLLFCDGSLILDLVVLFDRLACDSGRCCDCCCCCCCCCDISAAVDEEDGCWVGRGLSCFGGLESLLWLSEDFGFAAPKVACNWSHSLRTSTSSFLTSRKSSSSHLRSSISAFKCSFRATRSLSKTAIFSAAAPLSASAAFKRSTAAPRSCCISAHCFLKTLKSLRNSLNSSISFSRSSTALSHSALVVTNSCLVFRSSSSNNDEDDDGTDDVTPFDDVTPCDTRL
mmetsp:Transcript_49352/g.82100  ORF Transcript_49352/g.82100 Transcript_49352/m.82100 type:complete len:274 (-) Transcript_49352:726-1547(-)